MKVWIRGGRLAASRRDSFLFVLWAGVAATSLLTAGCMSESSGDSVPASQLTANYPPVVLSAEIHPKPLTLASPILVHIDAGDQDRDPLTFHHQWYVNGHPLPGQTGATLAPDLLKKGDIITVDILPDDGKSKGPLYRTPPATVVNTPPRVTLVSLQPQQAKIGDELRAEVDAIDPDGDAMEVAVRWWRNGKVVFEGDAGSSFNTEGTSRGDTIMASVIARDRESQGVEVFSTPVVISNSPPKLVSTPPSTLKGGRFEYVVNAIDPEGDPISYKLEAAPSGMTIEKHTGHITWVAPQHSADSYRVRVVAEDNHGAWSFQEFDLTFAIRSPS